MIYAMLNGIFGSMTMLLALMLTPFGKNPFDITVIVLGAIIGSVVGTIIVSKVLDKNKCYA